RSARRADDRGTRRDRLRLPVLERPVCRRPHAGQHSANGASRGRDGAAGCGSQRALQAARSRARRQHPAGIPGGGQARCREIPEDHRRIQHSPSLTREARPAPKARCNLYNLKPTGEISMPSSKLPDGELAFTYFPGNYRWSHGLLIALGGAPWGGAEIDEVNRIGLRLKDRAGDDDAAWFNEWAGEAERIENIGHAQAAKGHALTAAAYLLRASHYYHVGERFVHPKTDVSQAAYMRGVQAFRKAASLMTRPRIEHVEVPYEGASLPGILVHADRVPGRTGKGPVMLFLDGFDVTKEIQYFRGIPDLAARGVSCLI